MSKIIITGGSGFIGSCLIKKLVNNKKNKVYNIDLLTKTSLPESLNTIKNYKNYFFFKANISDFKIINKLINKIKPDIVYNLAAESHVDNSIENPKNFIDTNILGTYNLINICNKYINKNKIKKFKFIHVSTDEVYGSLKINQRKSLENDPYLPNSPYSASKASSDMIVRAWNKTYNFPSLITNCANNYGIYQHPEKLIPKVISCILENKKIPVYGNGKNIREWIHVEDHVSALIQIQKKGQIGESYNIGSGILKKNIDIVKRICKYADKIINNNKKSSLLIKFVKDRKGHDLKYALNSKKIRKSLNYKNNKFFNEELFNVVKWYIDNKKWLINKSQ